ncbi:MAG: peptidylprolyl isomerase [Bifidobacteriaceae bacterium]|nr:peptidylprolyl isomerase [Bifidobacteriaceae bacterium]
MMATKGSKQRQRARERRRALAYQARIQAKAKRRRRNRIIAAVVVAALALGGVVWLLIAKLGGNDSGTSSDVASAYATNYDVDSPTPTNTVPATARATYTAVPDASLSENRSWNGMIFTNLGEIEILLYGEEAPQNVANFVTLAKDGYYDGTTCHRLTTEGIYVLQCGSITGDGTDNPGYTFGPLENVPEDGIYPMGTIAMARTSDENGAGSQFFIVYEDTELPGGYSVIGTVLLGLEQITQVAEAGAVDSAEEPTTDGYPVLPLTIERIDLT